VAYEAAVGAQSITVVPFTASSNYPIGTSVVNDLTFEFSEVYNTFVRGGLINVVAPANAATATAQIVIVGTTGTGEVHAVSAVMVEPEGFLRPYFDANFAPYTDYTFEGNPNQSISDYYPNLLQNLTRLESAMPEYIPIGSTFSLITGAAALSNSNLVG
jgi:hypothetical protein